MLDVYNQLFCLFVFIITGIVIGILFDIFRISRKSFRTADWITSMQDILFWILTGCIMLFSIFTFNNGEIRSYVFIGILLGVIIYMLLISRFFIKYSVIIITFLKKILSYPINLIEKVIRKFIIRPICYFIGKGRGLFTKTDKIKQKMLSFHKSQKKKDKKLKEKEGFLQKM